MGSNFVLPIEQNLKVEQSKLEQLILAAEARRQEILLEAEQQALEIKQQAQNILTEAQASGEKIIADATSQAVQESDEIRETARKEGFESGYNAGYEDGTKQLEDKFFALDTFAQCQFDLKSNIVKSAELDIVELVNAITRKVCHNAFEADPAVLKEITISAIKLLKEKESITITINPELAEKIYAISDELKERIPQLQHIKIIEDKNVSPDGTIVESPLSRVDCRLKSQIDVIAEQMKSTYYSSSEEKEVDDEYNV